MWIFQCSFLMCCLWWSVLKWSFARLTWLSKQTSTPFRVETWTTAKILSGLVTSHVYMTLSQCPHSRTGYFKHFWLAVWQWEWFSIWLIWYIKPLRINIDIYLINNGLLCVRFLRLNGVMSEAWFFTESRPQENI